MHVLVLPVHEQEVDPADTDVHQLGVVPLAGVEDALVAEVLALKSEKKSTIIKTYRKAQIIAPCLITHLSYSLKISPAGHGHLPSKLLA